MRIVIDTGPNLPVPAIRGGAVNRFWSQMAPRFAAKGHEVEVWARRYPGQAAEEMVDGVRYRRRGGFDAGRSAWRNHLASLGYAVCFTSRLPPADAYVSNDAFAPWIMAVRGRQDRTLVAVGRAPKGQFRWYPRGLHLAVPTSAIRDALLAEAPFLAANCHVLPYAIDTAMFHPPQEPVEGRQRRVLFAGRIHPEKGIDLLPQALRLLRARGVDVELWLLGPSAAEHGGAGAAYREAIERSAQDLPLRWLDPVFEPSQLAAWYRQCAVFAYPSLAERGETFGVAVLEAMASGCVPVVSALGCFADLVDPGRNGFVFDHRSCNAAELLAEALGQALSAQDGMAESARATSLRFALDAVARAWLDVLETEVSGTEAGLRRA